MAIRNNGVSILRNIRRQSLVYIMYALKAVKINIRFLYLRFPVHPVFAPEGESSFKINCDCLCQGHHPCWRTRHKHLLFSIQQLSH